MNNSIVNETHEALNHIANFMDKIDNPFLGAPSPHNSWRTRPPT